MLYTKIKQVVVSHPLLTIILLAIVLRSVGFIFFGSFYGTTSELYRDLGVEYDLWVNHIFPLQGPSASLGGFNFGPIYYYLIAPFTWLFGLGPMGAILTSSIFSVASIWLVYKLTTSWFVGSKLAPALVAFCMAISIFDIQNAHYTSNPNTLPFFLLLTFYAATYFLDKRATWVHAVLLGIGIGVGTQLHGTALFILPLVVGLSFIYFRAYKQVKLLLLSFAVFTLTYSPYIYNELISNFRNTRGIINLGESNFSLVPNYNSFLSVVHFFGNLVLFKDDYFSLWYFYPLLTGGLLIIFIGVAVSSFFPWRNFLERTKKIDFIRSAKVLTLIWFFISLVTFLLFKKKLPEFYFLVLWPLPVFWFSWLLSNLYFFNKIKFYLLIGLFVFMQIIQLAFFYPFLNRPELSHAGLVVGFKSIYGDANGKTFNVIDGTNSPNLFVYYMKLSGLKERITRFQPDLVYYIYNDPSFERTVLSTEKYREAGSFQAGNSTIYRYEKIH